ncbi:MAG TPA: hypothetical protein ENI23_05835 [bacterium]|nr:hypothetical protein [bacterium]
MQGRELTLDDLLKRVSLKLGLREVIVHVLGDYDVGSYKEHEPLFVGHEEFNCIVNTSKGKYVIKFFNKGKKLAIAESNIKAMLEFDKADIPVPKMQRANGGEVLYKMKESIGKGLLFIMDYFDGKTFNEEAPTEKDMLNFAQIIAKVNNLKFDTTPEYDNWLPQYFLEEFEKNKKYLSEEDKKLLRRVEEIYRSIDFNKLTKGMGHFDLHRDNAKKDAKGNYNIFDLATVDYHYAMFDLGTFIALFCFAEGQTLEEQKSLYSKVISEYEKVRKLSKYEKKELFKFIKILYACNILAARQLIEGEDDDTEETLKWYRLGKWGLERFIDLDWN